MRRTNNYNKFFILYLGIGNELYAKVSIASAAEVNIYSIHISLHNRNFFFLRFLFCFKQQKKKKRKKIKFHYFNKSKLNNLKNNLYIFLCKNLFVCVLFHALFIFRRGGHTEF